MITEQLPTKYQITVNNVPCGSAHPTRHLAEMALHRLPPAQQQLAEITIVNQNGQQLLLG